MLRSPSLVAAALLSLAGVPNAQPPPPAARRGAPSAADSTLVVLLTGDGDWAEIDVGISDTLRAAGMAVVGLKSRSYLQGHERTPDGTARDVERIARYYGTLWQRPRVVLVGYSRGA